MRERWRRYNFSHFVNAADWVFSIEIETIKKTCRPSVHSCKIVENILYLEHSSYRQTVVAASAWWACATLAARRTRAREGMPHTCCNRWSRCCGIACSTPHCSSLYTAPLASRLVRELGRPITRENSLILTWRRAVAEASIWWTCTVRYTIWKGRASHLLQSES